MILQNIFYNFCGKKREIDKCEAKIYNVNKRKKERIYKNVQER